MPSAPAALPHISRADRTRHSRRVQPGRRSCRPSTCWSRKPTSASARRVKPEDLQWQTWPAATASTTFINAANAPTRPTQVTGSIARAPFIAGEPIREQKLVKANGSGFMAAILPTGMRAISTEISPETGAGGFILPNDRVDVILTKREKNADSPAADIVNSEIILSNVRVLAIDQAPRRRTARRSWSARP